MQDICFASRFADTSLDSLKTVIKIDQAEYRAGKQSDRKYQGHISKQLHHVLSGGVGPHPTPVQDD